MSLRKTFRSFTCTAPTAFALTSLLSAMALGVGGCTKKDDTAATTTAAPATATSETPASSAELPAGLKVEDTQVGTGAVAEPGKNVSVHYTGTLTDGKKFDSSKDRGQPFTFKLGAGQVIQGWDLGVKGMKEGGKRKLTIPAELGYGAAGAPPVIPGGATLLFDVELLKVE